MDCQRMHRVGDQVADAVQNCPVAGEARQPEELLGHDGDGKVPSATCGTGMSNVLRAVVANLEQRRCERRQPRFKGCRQIHCEGSMTCRARNAPCTSANARKRPIPPQTLKFTQVSRGKWNAMYQLASAIAPKNPTHAQVRRVQIGGGNSICFITTASRSRRQTSLPAARIAPNARYSTVGFHLMNVSSRKTSVAPPNTTMIASDSQWMAATWPRQ